jgi:hypothetical protein
MVSQLIAAPPTCLQSPQAPQARGRRLERRLGEVTKQAARLTEAMLESDAPVASFAGKIAALESERVSLEAKLAQLSAPVKIVALHPAAVSHYLEVVDDLAAAIGKRDGESRMAASIRELIESVVVKRTQPGEPIQLRVNGRLAALIGEPVFPDGSLSGVKLVAGERYGLNPNYDILVFSMECAGL